MANILYIIDDLMVGGEEIALLDIISYAKENGHGVTVATLFPGGPLENKLGEESVEIHCLKLRKINFPRVLLQIIKLIRRNKIDTIHTSRIVSDILGTLAGRISGVNRIFSSRGSTTSTYIKIPLLQIMDILLLPKRSGVIAKSETVKNDLLKNYNIPQEKILVINNFVDINKISQIKAKNAIKFKQDLRVPSQAILMGCVANLREEKNHAYLLRAFKRVAERNPFTYLVLIGEGPLHNDLEGLGNRLGIGDRVKFLGFRSDVYSILKILSVFILSSKTEGFGICLLEAMACKAPIVATKIGSIQELIESGTSGCLVALDSEEEFAKAIIEVINNKKLAAKLRENAWRTVREKYDIGIILPKYLRLYE